MSSSDGMWKLRVDDLVPGGLLGVRREAVVLKGVAGQTGNILHGQVDYRVFRNGGVAVAYNPTLVEVGGTFR